MKNKQWKIKSEKLKQKIKNKKLKIKNKNGQQKMKNKKSKIKIKMKHKEWKTKIWKISKQNNVRNTTNSWLDTFWLIKSFGG